MKKDCKIQMGISIDQDLRYKLGKEQKRKKEICPISVMLKNKTDSKKRRRPKYQEGEILW